MGVILRTPNTELLVRGKPLTYLSSASDAGATTLTVESIASFSISDYIQLGEIGAERTEIVQIHASTAPTGSTVTLVAASALYPHDEGTPVYKVDFNQVEFSIATTDGGSKSVLATSALTPDLMETIYDDVTNTTGFGYWRFKNSATTTYSSYSSSIPYAGYDIDACNEIFERALSAAGSEINPRLTYTKLFSFLNDFITLANSFNKRWSEARVLDAELVTLATGGWEIDLPTDIAQKMDPSAIISVRITGFQAMGYISQREYQKVTIDYIYSTLSTTITDASTTIVLGNSYNFADSGTITIEGDSIAYTGNTRSTGTLTGVTGIASTGHTAGVTVFQKEVTGVPTRYTISQDGKIKIYPIAGSEVNNRVVRISYFRRLPKVDGLNDKVLIDDIGPAVEYVAYRIKKYESGGSLSTQDDDYMEFSKRFRQTIERDTPGEPKIVRLG